MDKSGHIYNETHNLIKAKDRVPTRFYCKYWLGKDIALNIQRMLNDESYVPEIEKPEITSRMEVTKKENKDVKRAEMLLTNLSIVNDNLWTSFINDDIPVPIPDFKVKQFLEPSQRPRLHTRLEKIASKITKDIASQTSEKVLDLEHNPFWQHLTTFNDRQLLTECPHFGQWTDGRSHSRFHCLPSLKKVDKRKPGVVYREDILLCGEKMEELFDIPHAYPLLLAYILEDHPNVDKEELKRYEEEVWKLDRADDIYCHILQEAGFDPTEKISTFDSKTKQTKLVTRRDDVKDFVQMWIYLDHTYHRFTKMKVQMYEAVASYYEKHFPTIADAVYNWSMEIRDYIDADFSLKKKSVKTICHDFQRLERKVSVGLCSLLKVPYQPLYDAIYVRRSDCSKLQAQIDFISEMKKILEEK